MRARDGPRNDGRLQAAWSAPPPPPSGSGRRTSQKVRQHGVHNSRPCRWRQDAGKESRRHCWRRSHAHRCNPSRRVTGFRTSPHGQARSTPVGRWHPYCLPPPPPRQAAAAEARRTWARKRVVHEDRVARPRAYAHAVRKDRRGPCCLQPRPPVGGGGTEGVHHRRDQPRCGRWPRPREWAAPAMPARERRLRPRRRPRTWEPGPTQAHWP